MWCLHWAHWVILQVCEEGGLNRRGVCYLFLLQKGEGLYHSYLNVYVVPYILP